jgi:hypothetical protein
MEGHSGRTSKYQDVSQLIMVLEESQKKKNKGDAFAHPLGSIAYTVLVLKSLAADLAFSIHSGAFSLISSSLLLPNISFLVKYFTAPYTAAPMSAVLIIPISISF